MTPLSQIPWALVQRMRSTDVHESLFLLVEHAVDEGTLASLDLLIMGEVQAFVDRWAKDSGISLGEILGLAGLVDEHREAIDYDLLTLGLDLCDLGTARFDWRRLRAVVTYLPATSALARSVNGDKAAWSSTEHLLAAAVDALHAGNWQRGGGKGSKPKPVPRPGVEDDSKQTRRFGSAKIPIEQAKARWDRINRPVQAAPVNTICTADGCDRADIKARQLCPAHYMRWWRASRA